VESRGPGRRIAAVVAFLAAVVGIAVGLSELLDRIRDEPQPVTIVGGPGAAPARVPSTVLRRFVVEWRPARGPMNLDVPLDTADYWSGQPLADLELAGAPGGPLRVRALHAGRLATVAGTAEPAPDLCARRLDSATTDGVDLDAKARFWACAWTDGNRLFAFHVDDVRTTAAGPASEIALTIVVWE
jgi:hypothetical protein